jgi:hypothetical protein
VFPGITRCFDFCVWVLTRLVLVHSRYRSGLLQLLPQLSHLDGDSVPVTKSCGGSQSLNVSTISSVGSVTSFVSKFSREGSKSKQSRSKSPQQGFRAAVARPEPVKPQLSQQHPAVKKRAPIVPRCATVPLKRALSPRKVAETAKILGQRRQPASITAGKVAEMAKPKSVRPKFGSSEWTEQAGVAPIKKSGFGTSASRNMTFVKAVVEAADGVQWGCLHETVVSRIGRPSPFSMCCGVVSEATNTSQVLTVHGASRSKSPAATHRSNRYADTPPRYMQPTANVTVNQTVTPPATNRRSVGGVSVRTPHSAGSRVSRSAVGHQSRELVVCDFGAGTVIVVSVASPVQMDIQWLCYRHHLHHHHHLDDPTSRVWSVFPWLNSRNPS